MSWTIVLQIAVILTTLLAGGGGLSAYLGRSKVHAEATAVLTGISTRQIEGLQADLERVQTRQHTLERAMISHQRWDVMVIRKLEQLGDTTIGDPPDLWGGPV